MYKEEVKHTRQHLLLNPHLLYICIEQWEEQQILQCLKEIHNSLMIKGRILTHFGSNDLNEKVQSNNY